jgi:hypothetical protein
LFDTFIQLLEGRNLTCKAKAGTCCFLLVGL